MIFKKRRKTLETDSEVKINFLGKGFFKIKTFCFFFDHVLSQFFNYSMIDSYIRCFSDLKIEYHHLFEDFGICLSKILKKKKYNRYNSFFLCMDESFIIITIDFCNRIFYNDNIYLKDYDFFLLKEFFLSIIKNIKCCIHIYILNYVNKHHLLECIFKLFGILFYKAKFLKKIISTKGFL